MADKKRTVCIDFDGVLSDYSKGFQGKDVFGDAVPGASAATQLLKKKGWRIIVYTTRPATDAMRAWLKGNDIAYDYINENPDQPEDSPIANGCKIAADLYIDDRAMRFSGEWKWLMYDIAAFRPWQKAKEDEGKMMEEQYKQGDVWRKGKKNGECDCIR